MITGRIYYYNIFTGQLDNVSSLNVYIKGFEKFCTPFYPELSLLEIYPKERLP